MSMLSQDDIDAVLQNAEAAIGELVAASDGAAAVVAPRAASSAGPAGSPRLRRVLRLRVPLIVRLATRRLNVSDILKWGRGTIVEFDKAVDEKLELMVNDKVIGEGQAVKVAENFGLRVTAIVDPQTRIQSMGR